MDAIRGAAEMTWLLTGGAGYIGAHVIVALRAADLPVVVFDDLSTGVAAKVPDDVPLVTGSVLDDGAVRDALKAHRVTGVIHLAAKKAVEESMQDPLLYYHENVEGFRRVLIAMGEVGVDRLVLSSSAAVYGMPDVDQVTEQHPPHPINPYGQTKLACEWMASALAETSPLRTLMLRYFNVAGAASSGLGDPSVTNLIPLVLRALAEDAPPVIFGDDYATPDGTCVRDYIHVEDLADAHVAAAQALEGSSPSAIYNVSRGVGSSVREVIEVAKQVTGRHQEPQIAPRRAGDPARIVGTADAIHADLGWRASHDLRDMVSSAWMARRANSAAS
jgi:UDP-glucose 4-epimerase